jgi:uncharacterized protein
MIPRSLKFSQMPGTFAVCRLSCAAPVPAWASIGSFTSITRSSDELSIVCDRDNVPTDIKAERPWIGLQLHGPFPFQQAGVLASFIDPLAQKGIPIFAISTYDTDYVFVKGEFAEATIEALKQAGHEPA